jgi:hypothetical protein
MVHNWILSPSKAALKALDISLEGRFKRHFPQILDVLISGTVTYYYLCYS